MIQNRCYALSKHNLGLINRITARSLASSTVLAKKVTNPDGANLGYKLRVAKNSYRMGGKIGVETLIEEEKRVLLEFISYESAYRLYGVVLRVQDLRVESSSRKNPGTIKCRRNSKP